MNIRLTEEYRNLRNTGICSFVEAEKLLGRELTDIEEWAIYDNKQDEMLSNMGR